MPNHHHLLVRLQLGAFSERIQAFGTSYSSWPKSGPIALVLYLPCRLQAKHVDQEDYLVHLSWYIHRNSVEAGLVATPSDWELSSCPEYIGERAVSLSDTEIVLREVRLRENCCDFVENGAVKIAIIV